MRGMKFRLAQDELPKAFDSRTLDRGRSIWASERVRKLDASADSLRISGSVQGSHGRPYSQTVSLVPNCGGTELGIIGYCTCPRGLNCKHVGALLLEHCSRHAGEADGSPVNVRRADMANRGYDPSRNEQASNAAFPQEKVLAGTVADWLDRLVLAGSPRDDAREMFKPNQRQLRYVLNHRDAPRGRESATAWLRPVSARLRKDSSIFEERRYDPNNVSRPKEQRPRFLREEDLAILRDLAWLERTSPLANGLDVPLGPDVAS